MSSWLEHNALKVKDIDWYVEFFHTVFHMEKRKQLGEAPHRKLWLWGGIQLNEAVEFAGPEGRADHLGIMTDDVEGALERAHTYGVKELPAGRNWLELPDGLHIEICAGKPDIIKTAAELKPWLKD